MFNAALSELRTELSVQTRNDGLALKAMAVAIRREVEQLEQKMQEDIQTLKHEYVIIYFFLFFFAFICSYDGDSIEMDMNNRKAETRTEIKGFDINIEVGFPFGHINGRANYCQKEINNKFTISLGDLRTEIESVKWDATRRAICEQQLTLMFY